jgi:hypothetical protein
MTRCAKRRATRTLAVLLAVPAIAVSASACARKPVGAVILVSQTGTRVSGGRVSFIKDGARIRPDIWSPGNVVVYRVNATTGGGETALAGRAYRIDSHYRIVDIGAVDLGRTDEQLAGQFGVMPAEK